MRSILLLSVCLLIAGCSSSSSTVSTEIRSDDPSSVSNDEAGGGPGFGGGTPTELSAPTPVAIESGTIALTAENTKIQFVGTHVGDDPNPLTGVFTEFTTVVYGE